ncbi:MAP kinase kinase (MEK) [Coelomomyces lativittatus]|nr:MAP kinase kinase (MEK) [Coelomomyces lativittatus]
MTSETTDFSPLSKSDSTSTLNSLASTPTLKKKRNFKGLKLPTATANPEPVDDIGNLTQKIGEMAIENKMMKEDLLPSDFEVLGELGHGNGGVVRKVLHVPSQRLMAKKALLLDQGPNKQLARPEADLIKKQVVRELHILNSCRSDFIVGFYGAFIHDGEISICMEYMDLGSLDVVYRKLKRIDNEAILGHISIAVLEGLVYLYLNYRIIHRDIKPNNILLNSKGQIKICDFGVSGEAINSVVKTFVGTSAYMSPERIKGESYSVQSDVWSLGITLMELAIGRFPFPEGDEPVQLAVFELLEYIVNEEVPRLPKGIFSEPFEKFVHVCLTKDSNKRPTPSQLMHHSFIIATRLIYNYIK